MKIIAPKMATSVNATVFHFLDASRDCFSFVAAAGVAENESVGV